MEWNIVTSLLDRYIIPLGAGVAGLIAWFARHFIFGKIASLEKTSSRVNAVLPKGETGELITVASHSDMEELKRDGEKKAEALRAQIAAESKRLHDEEEKRHDKLDELLEHGFDSLNANITDTSKRIDNLYLEIPKMLRKENGYNK